MAQSAAAWSVKLPVELVGAILEHAVRISINTEPGFATGLQLVSRTTREWLLPIIYEVFVVSWPQPNLDLTPSFKFLFHLATANPPLAVRAYIRHIVVDGPIGPDDRDLEIPEIQGDWYLDSMAGDDLSILSIMEAMRFRPQRLFFGIQTGYTAASLGAVAQQYTQQAEDLRRDCPAFGEQYKGIQTAWHVRSTAALDTDGSPEESAAELEQEVEGLGTDQPFRLSQLRIVLDLESVLAVPRAVRLVVAILRCPGVSVTLVLPLAAGAGTIEEAATHDLFKTELALAVGDNGERTNLNIEWADAVARPKTGLEYTTAIRLGFWRLLVGSRQDGQQH